MPPTRRAVAGVPPCARPIWPRLARVAAVVLLAATTSACALTALPSPPTLSPDRPRAFRSVLDGRPRILTIELADGLWAAYDTGTATLYKIWRDGVALEGAVYDYRHGPQPRALGPAWTLRTGRTPWRLEVGGTAVVPDVRYRGHRFEPDAVVLLSELRSDGTTITLEERIAAAPGPGPAILWRYRADGVPADAELLLDVRLQSVAGPIETNAEHDGGLAPVAGHLESRLTLRHDGETSLLARFADPTIAPETAPEVDAAWQRLEGAGCPSCHATDARTVGPALLDIAERYDADTDTVTRLAAKVRGGGSGVWGETAMPANDFLSQRDAEALVGFILSLDGDDAAALRFAGELRSDAAEPSIWELAWEHLPGIIGDAIRDGVTSLFTRDGDIPGDGSPVAGIHPGFRLETIRPDDFQPKVGGMDFLPDGSLLVSTWDDLGAVYRLRNLDDEPTVKRIAWGLAEPLGLRVSGEEIFVLQKHELTRLVDRDGDEVTDEYVTVSNAWESSGNFHEFAFGLVEQDRTFLATLSSGVVPGGNSAATQPADRGSLIRISRDGGVEPVARGLRTPNGIGLGPLGEVFVADNQGAWLPASKIVHVRPGAFFGFRDVDPAGDADRPEDPPVVWLPQDEIGNSPSTPVLMKHGPYRGQMLHGEVTHGGIKRVFVESVDGLLQGAVFRFSQGLGAGVNRMVWGPDDKLYVGGIGNPGNWQHIGKRWYGLQRLAWEGGSAFEILAVRARPDGFEIELTEPGQAAALGDAENYRVQQWRYEPTSDYGGPKLDLTDLHVSDVAVDPDGRRVRLALAGLVPGSVVHLRLAPDAVRSTAGARLWSTEAWYTLNRIPTAP